MAARPRRTVRGKALRLACWNADGVRGRKLELEHFRSQHGVDICLLSETFLNWVEGAGVGVWQWSNEDSDLRDNWLFD